MKILFPIFIRHSSYACRLKPYKNTKWLMPDGNPTGLYVYNCVAGEKVPVILGEPNIATWYSCGPTVYDSAHIGHASCYVKLDIIQRILKSFFNIKLISAMGVTDIDDKIIKRAQTSKTDFRSISKEYEHEFWLDMNSLNVSKPPIITRVSDYIGTIESFIKTLLESDSAYVTKDSSVYFDTSKYSNYGKLQKMQDSTEPSKDKRNAMDFALWKGVKPGEPFWNASWGTGRPGWHIECSAMVSKIFGSQIDFHTGGIDLQFPHHENEEAQSCAYHNTKQWANYWIHTGHLNMRGHAKMSKSLKNTISIPELLENCSADTFRIACLLSHYRNQMEYNNETMKMSEEVLKKFKYFLKDALSYINHAKTDSLISSQLTTELYSTENLITEALKNDFDTATCINSLLQLMSKTIKAMKQETEYYPITILLISDYISKVLNNFGLKLSEHSENTSNILVDNLVDFRHVVRQNALTRKDMELLKACDLIRDKLKTMKIQINDTNDNAKWIYSK